MYYTQVKAYLDHFGTVKVTLFDDLQHDAIALIRDIYTFLDLDPTFRPDMSTKYYVSGVPKTNNALLNIVLNPMPGFVCRIGYWVLTEPRWIAIREKWKAKILVKPRMQTETRQLLTAFFREDILKLQYLLGRDLSHWLRVPPG